MPAGGHESELGISQEVANGNGCGPLPEPLGPDVLVPDEDPNAPVRRYWRYFPLTAELQTELTDPSVVVVRGKQGWEKRQEIQVVRPMGTFTVNGHETPHEDGNGQESSPDVVK